MKRMGTFTVVLAIGDNAYEVSLPQEIKMRPVFYVQVIM